MRKLLIAALIFAPLVAHANPYRDADYMCTQMADVTKVAAGVRAKGFPASDLKATMRRNQAGTTEASLLLAFRLVDQTYSLPPLSPGDTAQRFYNACMETWSEE